MPPTTSTPTPTLSSVSASSSSSSSASSPAPCPRAPGARPASPAEVWGGAPDQPLWFRAPLLPGAPGTSAPLLSAARALDELPDEVLALVVEFLGPLGAVPLRGVCWALRSSRATAPGVVFVDLSREKHPTWTALAQPVLDLHDERTPATTVVVALGYGTRAHNLGRALARHFPQVERLVFVDGPAARGVGRVMAPRMNTVVQGTLEALREVRFATPYPVLGLDVMYDDLVWSAPRLVRVWRTVDTNFDFPGMVRPRGTIVCGSLATSHSAEPAVVLPGLLEWQTPSLDLAEAEDVASGGCVLERLHVYTAWGVPPGLATGAPSALFAQLRHLDLRRCRQNLPLGRVLEAAPHLRCLRVGFVVAGAQIRPRVVGPLASSSLEELHLEEASLGLGPGEVSLPALQRVALHSVSVAHQELFPALLATATSLSLRRVMLDAKADWAVSSYAALTEAAPRLEHLELANTEVRTWGEPRAPALRSLSVDLDGLRDRAVCLSAAQLPQLRTLVLTPSRRPSVFALDVVSASLGQLLCRPGSKGHVSRLRVLAPRLERCELGPALARVTHLAVASDALRSLDLEACSRLCHLDLDTPALEALQLSPKAPLLAVVPAGQQAPPAKSTQAPAARAKRPLARDEGQDDTGPGDAPEPSPKRRRLA